MRRPAPRPAGRLADRRPARWVATLMAGVLLGALAAPAQAIPAVDDRSDKARRRAGPFEVALGRAQPAALRGSAAPGGTGPLSLAPHETRTIVVAAARGGATPTPSPAGDWAAVALADADPQATADPLDRLLRAHAVELADQTDPTGDATGLAASGSAVRLVVLAPSPGDAGAARARSRAAEQPAPAPLRLPLDGRRTLAAHVFAPTSPGPHPAVVMLPAETGAHAGAGTARCQEAGAQAEGACTARTLAQRYLAWGRWWASQGVTAVLVDHARAGATEAARAARWLRERDGIDGARIALQGWGRSGRTVVAAALQGPPAAGEHPAFHAGLALWPDCPAVAAGAASKIGFELLVLVAAREGEAAVERCSAWLEPSARAGGGIEVVVFDDAGRGFDDPAARPGTVGRAEWRANRFAMQDAMRRAAAFVTRRTTASSAAAPSGGAPSGSASPAPVQGPSATGASPAGPDRRD